MSAFPKLCSGAVTQYPATRSLAYSTRVLRFVDGSEQRFPETRGVLHSWVIRLNSISESELRAVEEFFEARQGALDDFEFTDPWDDVVYPSCRMENQSLIAEHLSVGKRRTVLVVKENRT